jgi:hypothetical protein
MSQWVQRVAAERGEAGERAQAISLPGVPMVTAFVQHRVKDYDAWRRVYDSVADMQKTGGVVAESVYRAEGDPNIVMVSHQFSSISAAHDFFDSQALGDAMRRAGVEEGTVRVEFFEDA